MKIKAQTGMVLNLDKCLGCHACSVSCKNAWTTSKGREYMWFNNVETKPGIGYPKEWENQEKYKGGWQAKEGKVKLRSGGKLEKYLSIFSTPHAPDIDDYGEPWTYTYERLFTSPPTRHQPVARPVSAITGKPMQPQWGSNWEDDLAGAPERAPADVNLKDLESQALLQFQKVFMLHLPRLCEHCLHPACVASCPSGALYKRDEDGIVLVDQTRCRGWRHCVSNCPYKKVYFNWQAHRSEKCLLCFPRVENGQPTLCSQSCVGRIRYMGVLLYDADRVSEAAAETGASPYESQLSLFLDPDSPEVRAQALKDGIHEHVLEAASRSPLRKLIVDWRIALPLHPEFRTLPMVWYVPPTSPLSKAGVEEEEALDAMRIPVRYLANMLSAGDETPVRAALKKLMAMRAHTREHHFGAEHSESLSSLYEAEDSTGRLAKAGLSPAQAAEMYELLAIARYNRRFVLPTSSREREPGTDTYTHKGEAGFCDYGGGI